MNKDLILGGMTLRQCGRNVEITQGQQTVVIEAADLSDVLDWLMDVENDIFPPRNG